MDRLALYRLLETAAQRLALSPGAPLPLIADPAVLATLTAHIAHALRARIAVDTALVAEIETARGSGAA